MYQMHLDLFSTGKSPEELCISWLKKVHGCSDAIDPIVEMAFEKSPKDAFERCKVLKELNGIRRVAGWGLDDLPLFAVFEECDHNVCWDRAWAARNGCSKEDVRRVAYWDYRRKIPVFTC